MILENRYKNPIKTSSNFTELINAERMLAESPDRTIHLKTIHLTSFYPEKIYCNSVGTGLELGLGFGLWLGSG